MAIRGNVCSYSLGQIMRIYGPDYVFLCQYPFLKSESIIFYNVLKILVSANVLVLSTLSIALIRKWSVKSHLSSSSAGDLPEATTTSSLSENSQKSRYIGEHVVLVYVL